MLFINRPDFTGRSSTAFYVVLKSDVNNNKPEINKLINNTRTIITDRDEIVRTVEDFYALLYASKARPTNHIDDEFSF